MANNAIIEEVPVVENETYQPGILKKLCLQAVEKYFRICQITKKDLPMTVIEDLYVVAREEKHKRYINALINEFQSIMWNCTPYKFSPNLFDAILYPDETTRGFNLVELVISSFEEYYRIGLYYGITRCPLYSDRYYTTCLYNTNMFENMRVLIVDSTHEGDRNDIINTLGTRTNYCIVECVVFVSFTSRYRAIRLLMRHSKPNL